MPCFVIFAIFKYRENPVSYKHFLAEGTNVCCVFKLWIVWTRLSQESVKETFSELLLHCGIRSNISIFQWHCINMLYWSYKPWKSRSSCECKMVQVKLALLNCSTVLCTCNSARRCSPTDQHRRYHRENLKSHTVNNFVCIITFGKYQSSWCPWSWTVSATEKIIFEQNYPKNLYINRTVSL